MSNWPFPPPSGPVPWTPQQIAEYQRQQTLHKKVMPEQALAKLRELTKHLRMPK